MTLPHGRDITAEQIELIVGREFSIRRFVSLCNSLIWATSKSEMLAQISFTERVLVRDNGVDAEWTLNLDTDLHQGSLVQQGWNVFQYKQRDLTGSDRQQIVASLRRDLQGAAQEVFTRSENRPDHYSLFTNIDLTHEQKTQLSAAIVEGYEGDLRVTIRGAAEIGAALNSAPHLRSAFFSIDQFSTWERGWTNHKTASIAGRVPDLTGRSQDVTEIKAAIDDERLRVVAITGPAGIGKSRLSLEATIHRQLETVVSLDAELGVTDLIQMQSVGQTPIVIIDNPNPTHTPNLISTAVSEGPKLVLIFTDAAATQQFNFGQDSRIKAFALKPLSEADSRELLRVAGAHLDYSVETWVTQKAGGNASVLIAAASIGDNLRVSGVTFLDQVGNGLEARAQALLGNHRVQIIRMLSVMTAIGINGSVSDELRIVCEIFRTISPNDVLSNISIFVGSGFVRQVGNYLEVVPPVLANRAAALGLAGREQELTALLSELSKNGRGRLLRRLQQLPANVLQTFLAELFQRGPLRDFTSALANMQLLHLLAPTAPVEAATLIARGLAQMAIEERLQLEPGVRRDLVWTLEELLFRNESSVFAIRSLKLLAEAETENYGNNATHIFQECFYPLHPQLPLTPHDRLVAFDELLTQGSNKQQKLMAIQAAASAFNSNQISHLRRSEASQPFDAVPTVTYGEVWDYLETLLGRLRQLMTDEDTEISIKAGETLILAIAEFTFHARPTVGIEMLENLAPQIISGTISIRVENYIDALHLIERAFDGRPDAANELQHILNLIEAVETGDFDTRVRRWVGTWDYGEQEQDETGQLAFHGEIEIRKLAQAAANDQNTISEDLLRWLTSQDAKRATTFFLLLGRYDENGIWEEQIDRLGETPEGELAFACFYGGKGQTSQEEIEDKLDRLMAVEKIRPEALLGATSYLPGSAQAIRRVLVLLERGVSAALTERRLMAGGWMNPLNTVEATTLLSAIAGDQLQNAALVVDFLAMWIHARKPLEEGLAELAWQCLESIPQGGEAWDFDLLAATLTPANLDRAFRLLERLLTLPSDVRAWEPLDRHSGNRFWNTLWTTNRLRSLELLFRVGASSPLLAWRINWHIPDVLNLETDQDFLREFARRDVHSGEFVSSCLTASKPGFWPIALDLLALYPDNVKVRRNIAVAASHMNHTIVGPISEHYIRCATAVEEVMTTETLPAATRTFLRELAANLRVSSQKEHRDELNESVEW